MSVSFGVGIPVGAFLGYRAINTQNYTESNIKLGVQHEGSTIITLLGSAINNTIFLTGSLPVILKSREVGYDGVGISTYIFESPTYTGGTSVPYQNPNAITQVAGLSQILITPTIISDGVLAFAPSHLIGSASNQGKGSPSTNVGQEKILKPNTAYLLRLENLDSSTSKVTSTLSWFEGELDLPK